MTVPDPDEVALTHPDRVVFEADGLTKGDVVRYYREVAPRMVPHLRGRPLSLERFRATIDAGGFFQQSAASHFPEWVPRIEVRRRDGKPGLHPGCDSPAALVYLANQGTLTFHGWAARAPDLESPDRLVLDLDPDGEDFAPVRRAALLLREVLDDHGLQRSPDDHGVARVARRPAPRCERRLGGAVDLREGTRGRAGQACAQGADARLLPLPAPRPPLRRHRPRPPRPPRDHAVDLARPPGRAGGHAAALGGGRGPRAARPDLDPPRRAGAPEDPWEGAAARGQSLAAAAASLGVDETARGSG